MLLRLVAGLWRRTPKPVRRWGVLLTETRFTVTTGAVIVDEAERVLLLQHRFRPGSGWGIPGGFVKAGEQPHEALRRELREEIGLELAEAKIAFVRALERYQQIEIIFRCHALGAALPQTLEVSRAAWFALDALPDSLSNDQRDLIERSLQSFQRGFSR